MCSWDLGYLRRVINEVARCGADGDEGTMPVPGASAGQNLA